VAVCSAILRGAVEISRGIDQKARLRMLAICATGLIAERVQRCVAVHRGRGAMASEREHDSCDDRRQAVLTWRLKQFTHRPSFNIYGMSCNWRCCRTNEVCRT